MLFPGDLIECCFFASAVPRPSAAILSIELYRAESNKIVFVSTVLLPVLISIRRPSLCFLQVLRHISHAGDRDNIPSSTLAAAQSSGCIYAWNPPHFML